jgi:hypothetical protein
MQIFRFSVYITFSNGISLFSVYIAFILYCFFMFFQTKSVYNPFLLSLVTGPNAKFSIFSLYHFFQCYITFFSLYHFYFILLFHVFSNKKCVQPFFTLISHGVPMGFFDFQFISLFLMVYHFFQFISLLFYIAFSCFFKQKLCTTIFYSH